MRINFKKINEDAVLPSYAKEGDAGMDLTTVGAEIHDKFIQYHTGLAVEIPEGYVGLLFPRSSVTKKDLMLKNSIGVIDSGYSGEICFRFKMLKNPPLPDHYQIGDKVGQLLIIPIPKIQPRFVDELSSSERGEDGFGSTGN